MPKPPELIIPQAVEVMVRPCPQHEELKTPVALVSVEDPTALRDLIIQDANTFDETSKENLDKHFQVYDKSIKEGLAHGTLQMKQVGLLLTINDGSKERRSTKSVVLGKGKNMAYEDLIEAREKRAAQDKAKEVRARTKRKGKGKGGRRGKTTKASAPDGEALEKEAPEGEASELGKSGQAKRGRKRKNPPESVAPEPASKRHCLVQRLTF
ncbi:hypothetical protein LTS18_002286 [Coniosporium uncinatum]|uniref:Uncharacterized protein n=1 Tax=Coniosporium uncinatum TaxID=93489 RepID=A0ACC3DBM4_9PEZI|nr:hypothetical protein LTS18_002286 [Coniosporium uncinatum]